MEQIGSHITDFPEIFYLIIFGKSAEKIQVSLKSGKITWRLMYIYDNISLNSCQNEKYFRSICRENQNRYFTFNNIFPSLAFYALMWKNMVQPDRLQMAL